MACEPAFWALARKLQAIAQTGLTYAVNESPREAVEREALEESGFDIKAVKLACVCDRAKHPHEPAFPFHVYKMFFLCDIVGGGAKAGSETLAAGFYPPDALPPLSVSRVLPEQIERLFAHCKNPLLPTEFD